MVATDTESLAVASVFFLVILVLSHPKVVTILAMGQLFLPTMPKVPPDYMILKEFIEKRYTDCVVYFINEKETLLNPGAEKTPISTVPILRSFKVEGLRIWLVRKSA